MTSTTTCPHCQTQFLVTPEQVSKTNGKVRCGQCLKVFNALENVVPEAVVAVKSAREEKVVSPVAPPTPTVPSTPVESMPVANATSESTLTESSAVEATTPEPVAEVALAENIQSAAAEVAAPAIEKATLSTPKAEAHTKIVAPEVATNIEEAAMSDADQPAAKPEEKALEASAEMPAKAATQKELALEIIQESQDVISRANLAAQTPDAPIQELPAAAEDLSNINHFDYKPEYQHHLEKKKSGASKYLIIGLLLILLAIAQALYFFRHDIVDAFPSTYDAYKNICQSLGCKVSLPKNIELFSIDDSDIEEDMSYKNVYLLSSTLTNHATFKQAYPNIEVTLTDTDDKPTLRRVFKPYEYLAEHAVVDNGVTAGESIPINMSLLLNGIKPAGYRVLVTY